MKKLMTMIAAVAAAFGLFATPEFKAGTCFNDWTGIEDRTGDTNLTWSTSLYESTLINPAGWSFSEEADLPEKWSGEVSGNALSIKTALNTEFVTCEPTEKISLGEGEKIYVDTLVKFTAFDEDAVVPNGTKLGVWLKEVYEADGVTVSGTNLYITAGAVESGEVTGTPVNYNCGAYTAGEWCRLTIKSIGDVTGSSSGVYGFVVYINNYPVQYTQGIDFDGVTLSALAAHYNANKWLFPSLGDSDISSLAISGQGAIDDIAFTTKAPWFAEDEDFYTVTWGEDIESVSCDSKPVTKGASRIVTGSAETFVYEAAAGFISSSTNVTAVKDQVVTLTAQPLAATVVIGGVPTPVASFEEAVAAINASSNGGSITLNAPATFNATLSKATVLDLAGQKIEGVISASANLEITNSVPSQVDGTNTAQIVAIGNVISQTAGALTIWGDCYIEGDLDITTRGGAASGSIYGGQFSADPSVYVALGFSANQNETYGYWEVSKYIPPVAKIVSADETTTNEYTTLCEAAAAAQPGDTMTLISDIDLTETAVFQGEGTNTAAIVFDFNGKTVTYDINNKYGIVIADANVKMVGTGSYVVKSGSASSASLIMVGVADQPGQNGKPGTTGDTFIGRLVVDDAISFMAGTNTSCCIRQEYGYCEINEGTFDAEAAFDGTTKKANGIKASANNTAMSEALIAGGTFEIPFATKGEGDPKVWPSMKVTGGKFKTVPTDATGITISEGCKLKQNPIDDYYYVTAIDYATLTIVKDENVTVVVSNGTEEVVLDNLQAKFDKDDEVVVTAYPTFAEGYELDADGSSASFTAMMTVDATITILSKSVSTDPIIDPTHPTVTAPETCTTKEDAEAWAAENVKVETPNAAIVSTDDYTKYFKFVATGDNAPFTVSAELADDVVKAENETAEVLTDVLALSAAGAINLTNAKPGLMYSLYQGNKLDNTREATPPAQADKDGKVTLNAGKWADAGFYQVLVTVPVVNP